MPHFSTIFSVYLAIFKINVFSTPLLYDPVLLFTLTAHQSPTDRESWNSNILKNLDVFTQKFCVLARKQAGVIGKLNVYQCVEVKSVYCYA